MTDYISLQLTDRVLHDHPQDMIGLFFEDINYAADGGLYAEMLENRSFEAADAYGCSGSFYTVPDPGYAWDAYGGSQLRFVTGSPLSTVNPHYLRLITDGPGQGFSNKAYDGIRARAGMTYHVSFYARVITQDSCRASVRIEKDGKVCAQAEVPLHKTYPHIAFADLPESDRATEAYSEFVQGLKQYFPGFTDDPPAPEAVPVCTWVRYELDLTADADVCGGLFVLTVDGAGVFEFDLISMMPDDAVAGIFRRDLFDALDALHPGFIRFPGGCIVEGVNLENRYQWKHTVGPLKDRRIIPNLWAFDENRANGTESHRETGSHYTQSYGLGFYEFFLLCELLGARPLPVVGAGMACQFRSQELVDVDSPEFEAYVQDALDLIEFANGGTDTVWGGLRAAMGHPAPFGMDMIGVGNEQWETRRVRFRERARRFEEAIHRAYPDMKVIGTAGPLMHTPTWTTMWDFYRQEEARGARTFAVDEHYYRDPAWFAGHTHMYDDYPRTPAVFAGEYAAQSETRENSLEAALSEAAFLTGVERNSDAVRLASYAPLFNRIGHSQWQPDLIWFNDEQTFLTPSWYVQMLFSVHAGDCVLKVSVSEGAGTDTGKEAADAPAGEAGKNLYMNLTGRRDPETGAVTEWILKLVNLGECARPIRLQLPEGLTLPETCRVLELSGDAKDRPAGTPGTLPEPVCLTDQTVSCDSLCIPAKTMQVIRVK